MKLSSKVIRLVNEQINKEFFSSYLYLDIANHYRHLGLEGFAAWFDVQAKEEADHGVKFTRYLQDNGEKVVLDAIANPTKTYATLRDPLVESLAHEESVTASIDAIYAAAVAANDYRTQEFLLWFIREQAEEEKNANDNLLAYDNYAGDKRTFLLLDKKLGKRGQSED
jgi:ferritin